VYLDRAQEAEGRRFVGRPKKFLDKVNESGGVGIVVNSIESLKIQLEGAEAV
jgi:hypothetical protein